MSTPGQRRNVTLDQVARDAGVSVSAASFVLSGRGGRGPAGSQETKERVLASARRLGYRPNLHARAMRTGQSTVIALAPGPLQDPWSTTLTEAVIAEAGPHGLSTVLLADNSWSSFLSGYSPAAALVAGVRRGTDQEQELQRLASTGQQLVYFGDELEVEGPDLIHSTPIPALASAYDLLRTRHAQVALFSHYRPGTDPSPNRADSFLKAVSARGDAPTAGPVVFGGQGRRESFEFAVQWLSSTDRPRALIGATAYLALSAQAAAHVIGLRVPEDLEIVSLGDVPRQAEMFAPVSYWGVRDVFIRTAEIVVARARAGSDTPPQRHEFSWEFFPGATTVEPD